MTFPIYCPGCMKKANVNKDKLLECRSCKTNWILKQEPTQGEKSLNLTWDDFERDCNELSMNIKADERFKRIKNITGIPRGGLPMAVKLSHLLKIPFVEMSKADPSATILVDDISDSGKTFLKNKNYSITMSWCIKERTSFRPDFYMRKYDSGWIVFPWEVRK